MRRKAVVANGDKLMNIQGYLNWRKRKIKRAGKGIGSRCKREKMRVKRERVFLPDSLNKHRVILGLNITHPTRAGADVEARRQIRLRTKDGVEEERSLGESDMISARVKSTEGGPCRGRGDPRTRGAGA